MKRPSPVRLASTVLALLVAATAGAAASPEQAAKAAPPTIEAKTAAGEARRLPAAQLGRAGGPPALRDRPLRGVDAPRERVRLWPRLQRHRPRPGRPRRVSDRGLRARGAECPDGPAQLRLPCQLDKPRGGARRARRLRAVGALGLRGRGGDGGPRTGRRDRLAPARRPRPLPPPAAGSLRARRVAEQRLPSRHVQLPEEHRAGGRAHVRAAPGRRRARGRRIAGRGARLRRRALLRGRRRRCGLAGGREPARAPLLLRAARRGVPTPRRQPARRLHHRRLPGALRAPRGAA
jgi:hypothetical protein